MQKTMIYLDEDTHRRLKYMALDERISMAQLIRQAIDHYLEDQPKRRLAGKPVARKAVRR